MAAAAVKGAAKAKVTTKPKAAPQPAKEEAPIDITNTPAVDAALEGVEALDAAQALVSAAEETHFTLGGVLAHIYFEGHYKSATDSAGAAYENFQSYIEGDLGVAYRRNEPGFKGTEVISRSGFTGAFMLQCLAA